MLRKKTQQYAHRSTATNQIPPLYFLYQLFEHLIKSEIAKCEDHTFPDDILNIFMNTHE